MENETWEKVPMEPIEHEPGNGDRFAILVITKRYGGDSVSPLYEKQARRLIKRERDAGHLIRVIRFRPDGHTVIESDF